MIDIERLTKMYLTLVYFEPPWDIRSSSYYNILQCKLNLSIPWFNYIIDVVVSNAAPY